MIKLREPIQLKNKAVCKADETFGERIRENYNQINISIEPEDLLHIVTSPAEVFYAEGNQTSIFNRNVKIENTNANKIDIVNRLINRIMLSPQANFSYQDTTYISNILHKLGITDEKRFMKQITKMMSDRQTYTRELMELSERVETLREKIPEVMESIEKRAESLESENRDTESRMYLAESIYNRLQTDRIYDTVWNFNKNYQNEQNITQRELSISEQKRSSTYIKLNNLALKIMGAPVEMVHIDNRFLEETQIENIENVSEESVRSQLTWNSLFNLVEQIYESRNTQIDQGISTNIDASLAMFESAGNSFTRYVENIVAPVVERSVTQTDGQQMVSQVLNYLEQQSVTEDREEILVNELEQINKQNVENVNQYLRVMQQLRERVERPEGSSPKTQGRTIRESLDALDNPEPLLLRYKEEQKEADRAATERRDETLEAYPERVRPLLKYIDDVMSGRGGSVLSSPDTEDALAMLNADLSQIELAHRKESVPQIIENDTEKNQVAKQLVEHIRSEVQGTIVNETVEQKRQVERNLQLVHKVTETINEEEILERIDELRSETRQSRVENITENSEIVTNVNRVTSEESVINETVNQTELTELVREHVISQMGDLSDQVYAKIEKRLQNEKIRRGY